MLRSGVSRLEDRGKVACPEEAVLAANPRTGRLNPARVERVAILARHKLIEDSEEPYYEEKVTLHFLFRS